MLVNSIGSGEGMSRLRSPAGGEIRPRVLGNLMCRKDVLLATTAPEVA